MNIELPENIRKILLNKEFKVNTVGKTNSQVYMYNNMVLKIQNQSNETENEIEIMQKISENLPIPKVIEQVDKEGLSYTLMSRIEGNMLSEKEYVNNPEILINLLCEGLKMLWDIDINQYDIKKVSNIYERLKSARFNVENNLVDVNNVMPETFGKDGFSSPKELLEWLETICSTSWPSIGRGSSGESTTTIPATPATSAWGNMIPPSTAILPWPCGRSLNISTNEKARRAPSFFCFHPLVYSSNRYRYSPSTLSK